MFLNFYGLVYFFSFLFFYFYLQKTDLKNKDLYFFLNIIFLIIFARIFHVLFELDFYLKNLLQIIQIWKGGLSFYGGLFGIILANLLYLKITKENKQNILNFLEKFIIFVPIFIFFGRIANYFNKEHPGVFPFLPQQIFEALLHGIFVFLVLIFFKRKKILVFFIAYTIARFITELFRFNFGLKTTHFVIILFLFFSIPIINTLYKDNDNYKTKSPN